MVARCEMAMARGDDARALRALSKVTPSSPHYPAAALALADVHSKRGDNAAYVRCHRELAEHRPQDASSHVRLAEAYQRVGQPQAAVSALEKAAALAPNDAQIARRLGAALAATHDFERAVACYETARKTREENAIRARSAPRRGRFEKTERLDSGKPSESIHRDVDETALDMQMELAELYKRLRRWDDAEDALARRGDARGGKARRRARRRFDIPRGLSQSRVVASRRARVQAAVRLEGGARGSGRVRGRVAKAQSRAGGAGEDRRRVSRRGGRADARGTQKGARRDVR